MNNSFSNRIATTTLSNGKQVQLYKLSASRGIVIGTQLGKTFLPLWGTFLSTAQDGEGLDWESLSLSLVSELDNFQILPLIQELLKELAVNGSEIKFDDYFMANYGELVEIVVFALKENFSSFFSASGLLKRFLPSSKQEVVQAES